MLSIGNPKVGKYGCFLDETSDILLVEPLAHFLMVDVTREKEMLTFSISIRWWNPQFGG